MSSYWTLLLDSTLRMSHTSPSPVSQQGLDPVPVRSVAEGRGQQIEDGGVQNSCSSDNISVTSFPSPPMSRIGLNDYKAGMEGLDKDKINQIILDSTRGSKYYENEVKKEKQVTKRINILLENLKKINPAQKISSQRAVDREIEKLEDSRVLDHIVVHVDMDAFYAAVEMRDNPKLRDVPMAVGSYSMLSTSNYLARRFGVRAAMPGFIAMKLCPDLVIVKVSFDKYRKVSKTVQEVLVEYDPNLSPVGLDESYLDLTAYVKQRLSESETSTSTEQGRGGSLSSNVKGCVPSIGCDSAEDEPLSQSTRLTTDSEDDWFSCCPDSSGLHWNCAETIVEEIRSKIHSKTGLTASAGIAPNMMLAKVASDMNKPNGQFMVKPTREGVLQFVQQLPIRKISGIGKVSERMLKAVGVTTCRDLYDERATLNLLFSPTSSHYFLRICLGIGSSDVNSQSSYERKSISTERTFSEISTVQELQDKCLELCKSLAEDMQQKGIKGQNVTLKLKKVNFEVKSRAETLSKPISTVQDLYNCASQLLKSEIQACSPQPLRLRLMGVRASMLQHTNLEGAAKQETLTHFFNKPVPMNPGTLTQAGPSGSDTSSKPNHLRVFHEDCEDYHFLESSHEECFTDPVVDGGKGAGNSAMCVTNTAVCPVCNSEIAVDNILCNRHIDECLNRMAIQQAPADTFLETTKTSPLKNSSLQSKVGHNSPVTKTGKKRKNNDELLSGAKKHRTLESFWKK